MVICLLVMPYPCDMIFGDYVDERLEVLLESVAAKILV